jgi:hypothetical protein
LNIVVLHLYLYEYVEVTNSAYIHLLNADCVSKSAYDALPFLVELSSATSCKSVLSKIRGYHRSMPMAMVITFPGNYCVGEGNTINKSISISL